MFRPSVSPRMVVGFTLAATLGAGIGLGMVGLGTSPASSTPQAVHTLAAAAATSGTPATAPTRAAAPLTIDQAKAVALQASPGTVVEVKQENGTADPADATEANDPNETNDPNEANDPHEAADTAEPTGLTYDVTVQHQDGSATKVVVDGTTGRVVSTKVEDAGN